MHIEKSDKKPTVTSPATCPAISRIVRRQAAHPTRSGRPPLLHRRCALQQPVSPAPGNASVCTSRRSPPALDCRHLICFFRRTYRVWRSGQTVNALANRRIDGFRPPPTWTRTAPSASEPGNATTQQSQIGRQGLWHISTCSRPTEPPHPREGPGVWPHRCRRRGELRQDSGADNLPEKMLI